MCLAVVAVVAASACSVGLADEQKAVQTARTLASKHAASIVTVSAVVKIRFQMAGAVMPMPAQEHKIRVAGAVIDASGLTVVPTGRMELYRSSMSRAMGGGENKLEIKTEISDVKIHIPGGKDVPARLALKDEDLGLVFVQPKKGEAEAKGIKWRHLKLTKAPPVQVLDPLIGLYRLGKTLGHKPAVRLGRVAAVVDKPRPFIVHGGVLGGQGMPVFNADGKLLGIIAMLPPAGDSDQDGAMFMMDTSNVIVPPETLKQAAAQVLEGDKGKDKSAAKDGAGSDKEEKGVRNLFCRLGSEFTLQVQYSLREARGR
jgi:hypothetical protein